MKNKTATKRKSPVVKRYQATYTWKPPTKEEEAAKKEAERQTMLRELKELAIFLEGMKKSSPIGLYPLGHTHLSTLWKTIQELREKR